MHMSYWRFAAMIATSTLVMFGLMYLNTYALEHVLWSETRGWMALLMGSVMAVIMLSFMVNMYRNTALNIAIYAGSVVVFALSLWLVRSQVTVNDVEYMQAMVPHHSIAIMTSERARITDPRVRKLADEIIEAQRREISEMKYLIKDLRQTAPGRRKKVEKTMAEKTVPEIVTAAEAIKSPDTAKIDPATLDTSEIESVIPPGPHCSFAYTAASPAIFAASIEPGAAVSQAVIKLRGRLVRMTAREVRDFTSLAGGGTFSADGIQLDIEPDLEKGKLQGENRRWPAEAHFRVRNEFSVGYSGWYACSPPNNNFKNN